MMHTRLIFFFTSLILSCCSLPHLSAQSDDEMAKVFEWKFSMTAPDATFTPLEEGSGWEESSSQAKVICMANPIPYQRMADDLQSLSSEDGQKVIEKKPLELGGKQGLLILLEFTPMAGEDTEATYSLMYVCPYDDSISLLLNAQYPKKEHERLYPKLLASFATVRKINP